MTDSTSPYIEFRGSRIPIEFGYLEATTTFKEEGLNLLRIFQSDEVVMTILSNDEVMLRIYYFFVKDHCTGFQDAIKDLDPAQMNVFREAFWKQVVNFSPAPMRPSADLLWKEVKEALKSPKEMLETSSQDSSGKQE